MKKYDLEPTDSIIEDTIKKNNVDNKNYIESIIGLLANIEDNYVICVDGEWGSGKTFLVKQLEYTLNHIKEMPDNEFQILKDVRELAEKINDNNIVFYYNAWANDEHIDPLQSIIFSVLNEYDKYKNNITNDITSEAIVKGIGKTLVSILSQGLLNIDINTEVLDEITTFEDLVTDVNTYEERKANFRKLLDTILKEKRMILIIDELDRCNPAFATKLLEVIKHFYDYKKITVIVVANNKQLQHTIKQQYGIGFDAYAYLDKFYDFVITIDNNRSIQYTKDFLDFEDTGYIYCQTFFAMISKYGMTLRECNKYKVLYDSAKSLIEAINKNGGFISKSERDLLYSVILPIIYAFKIKDINAYNNCLNKRTDDLKEAVEYLQNFFASNEEGSWLKEIIGLSANSDERLVCSKIVEVFERVMKKDNFNKTFLSAIRCSL